MKVQSDREKAFKEIVESRKEQLAKEAAEAPGEVIEAEIEIEPAPPEQEKPDEIKAADEPPPEPAAEPADSPAAEPEVTETPPEAPKMVKAKVDDVEYDVPQSEIDKAGSLALWQMEKAMQNRLKEVNEKTKAVAEALRQLQQQPQQPPQNPEAELVNQLNVLRYGEDKDAIQLLKELRTPQVPLDKVAEIASKRVEWNNAVKQFVEENADILKDPDVQVIALARENQLKQVMQQTQQWPQDFSKFYKDLGAALRAKYGKPAAVDLESRREKKEAIAEPRTASGRVPTPPPPKAKTTADVVAEMRKARGQPVH